MDERRFRDAIAPIPIRSEPHHCDYSKNELITTSAASRSPRRPVRVEEGKIEEYGQASRAISTASLNPSLDLHSQPIKQVVFLRPSGALRPRET